MDVEKEIIRDVWFFLRDHRTPPAPGLEGRLAYWDRPHFSRSLIL